MKRREGRCESCHARLDLLPFSPLCPNCQNLSQWKPLWPPQTEPLSASEIFAILLLATMFGLVVAAILFQ